VKRIRLVDQDSRGLSNGYRNGHGCLETAESLRILCYSKCEM